MFVLRAFLTDNTPVPCERWQFAQLPIRIGRNPQNDYVPQHPAVSSFHACIEDCGGKVCIRDVGSSNGVFLVTPAVGDLVRIDTNISTDLAPAGFRFFLSASVWVHLDIVQEEPYRASGSHRPNATAGTAAIRAQPIQQLHGAESADAVAPQPWTGPTVPMPQQAPPRLATFEPSGAPTPARNPSHPEAPAPAAHSPQCSSVASAAPHGSHDESPQSQFFNVELEYLALQGLRELVRSLLPGRKLETTGDVARLITKLHDTVDVFCRSFIPLRQGYAQFVSSLDLERQRSMRLSPTAAMLEAATTPEAVAQALLDPRDHSTDAPRAVESVLGDLARHQIALLDGMMQGVRALLEELSPDKIDKTLTERGTADLFGSRHRARWTEFCERYERLADEREAFAVIFGRDFADVYRRYWLRDGAKNPSPPSGAPRG